jgi:flagellar biosynthetic protein FlhB
MGGAALEIMRKSLQIDVGMLDDPHHLPEMFGNVLFHSMMVALPIFGGTFVGALIAPALLGGWNFSPSAILPDFSRLNPLSGIGRVFSVQGLFELVKSIIKFTLIGACAGTYVWKHRFDLMGLGDLPTRSAIAFLGQMVIGTLEWATAGLVIIALIDAPYQRWNYIRQMRMTRQEVRDEYKQMEGRPEVKARIRRLQQEMSRRRMMEQVPTADVVITNPTHYAVALKYAAEKMRAPVVVAKGAGEVAASIRDLAMKNRVPLVSAPPLARALYREVDLEDEIPVPLYAAVAKVLTYIYQLRSWSGGERPKLADIGEVPGGEPDS